MEYARLNIISSSVGELYNHGYFMLLYFCVVLKNWVLYFVFPSSISAFVAKLKSLLSLIATKNQEFLLLHFSILKKLSKNDFNYFQIGITCLLSHWAKSKCTRLTLNRKYWDDLVGFDSPSAGSGQASQPDRRLSK